MVVQEEFEAPLSGLLGESDRVFQVVWQPAGSVKQPQPNPVVTVVAEDLEPRLGLSLVLEHRPLRLGLLQEGEISPDGVVSRFRRAAKQELYREHER